MTEATTNRDSQPTDDAERKRRRRRRRAWFSLAFVTMVTVAAIVVARTNVLARKVAQLVRTEVSRQTGLELRYDHVGFSWRHLTVRAEGVQLLHPREGRLASIDVLEVRPSFASLFRSAVKIASIDVDGGEVVLRFRHGQLVNGPTSHDQGNQQPGELPFRDLAISDVHVRIEHDQLGTLDLPSVDLDVRNVDRDHLLLGVLAQDGSITNARCFSGRVSHLEARGELDHFRTLTVALAHVEAGRISARVREAVIPLDRSGPIHADAEISGPIPAFLCPIEMPHYAPRPHGDITLNVNGRFDPSAMRFVSGRLDPTSLRFEAVGHLHTRNTSLEMPWGDQTGRFGLGDDNDIHFTANQSEVRFDSLTVHHSGGTLVSPGSQPQHPIRLVLGDFTHPTLEGHLDVAGVQLVRLVHELSVTEFAKVSWNISASADLHGELWRFGEPADPHHPALWFDVNADTRDFAMLRDFYMREPQFAVISIPRGNITGQISIDPTHVRFRRLVGLFGVNNRSRLDVDLVQLRMQHDDRYPDVVLEGARGNDIVLEDIGHIADFPISGTASFTAHGGGIFRDPIVTGEAHVRNFHYNGLPLGDYDTRAGTEWYFRNLRVDMPIIDARAGRSTFVARNSYLDFSRWTLSAGTHVASDNFYLRDYYHMFKFENDPTFELYGGQTMPRCPSHGVARVSGIPCVDPSDPYESDPRRTHVPAGTNTGHVETDVTFVLGRPGDDPGGVMDVELWGRNLYVTGFDEPLDHFDVHHRYTWLIRAQGYRGARQLLDYGRGRYAGGTVEAWGNVDLGGQMHFTANVRDVSIAQTVMAHDLGVAGLLNASGSLEGWPESQRWTLDADLHNVTTAQRNFGDVTLRLRSHPETTPPRDPAARPPRTIWTLDGDALNTAMHVTGSMTVPWHATSWRDVDGITHPSWDRDWTHSLVGGHVALVRTLDLAPFVPARLAARMGSALHASLRGRLDIDHALLGDLSHADARLTVDELDVGTEQLRLALDHQEHLSACVHDGIYWIEPSASTNASVCETVPAALRGRVTVNRATAPLPSARFLGPEGTQFTVSGGGNTAGRLGVRLDGQLDLSRLASLIPGVSWARGAGTFQVNVAGDAANPQLSGMFQLHGGAVGADVLPNPIEDIELAVRLDGSDIVLSSAAAQFGSSSIDMTGGRIHIAGRDIDRVQIPVRVQNLSLVPMQGVEVALDANTLLSWQPGQRLPVFSGDVNLARVRYTRPIDVSGDRSGARLGASGSNEAPYDPNDDHVQLNLNIHAREPIRIANNLVDGEITIAENEQPFRVLGTDQRVGVIGTLLIPRGRVVLPFFRGSDFEISRGRIEFNSAERIDPNFDLRAQTEVRRSIDASRNQQWRVDLHAFGSPGRFSLDKTSDPPLSFNDIALLLTFGATRAELDQAGASNLGSAIAVQALATASGIDRTVRQAIGFIDEFRIGTAYSPSSGRTVPQVAIGRRVSDNVHVGATVNTTDQREMRATVDVRVSDHTSVQLGWDNYNNSTTSTIGNLGADVRWRLEFE
jgi:translocation and assembly module TamB